MNNMRLLLVEDNEADQNLCRNASNDFNNDHMKEASVTLDVCKTSEVAIAKLKESHYDGVIIDMKLTATGSDEGNQVIEQIKQTLNRIPVVVMTGTPEAAERDNFPLVNIYNKGDIAYIKIIEQFWYIYRTGLTRIMGGKGVIEEKLTKIFTDNLLPILKNNLEAQKSWIKYAQTDSSKTEKALLRYALNHLIQHLDNDIGLCYPEEMYIYPPMNNRINTGCILKKKDKDSDRYYIVMNPACDLAERNDGDCNTDRALLVEIQLIEDIFPNISKESLSKSEKKELEKIYKNNKSLYYHWLPETFFYSGGVINFRRVSTYTEEEIADLFNSPLAQISPPFLKDMVSRFSSYYARQGQPDIDIEFAGN